jgi:hypothetical protein
VILTAASTLALATIEILEILARERVEMRAGERN